MIPVHLLSVALDQAIYLTILLIFQLVYEITGLNTIFSTVSIIVLCSYGPPL